MKVYIGRLNEVISYNPYKLQFCATSVISALPIVFSMKSPAQVDAQLTCDQRRC